VADHLCDFHTLPLDPGRLSHTLGHAWGCAQLRERPHPTAVGPHVTAAGRRAPADMALTGDSGAIARLRQQIAKVAATTAPVLIWGESGTGKELTARAIHDHSARAGGPFVPVNCGAMPASLIQSELFGHERGAFTGATRDKRGLIEAAAGGTLFLDEIGDLPLEMQSNLLRFLQEKTIHRVGATRSVAVDARVIAASHVKLALAVARGTFREDLFYRLNVLTLDVPPLRERKDDLVVLAHHFFTVFSSERAPRLKGFSSKALQAIRRHDWPGNVRELINRVRRAMVMAEGRLIGPHDLGLELCPVAADAPVDALGGARERAECDTIRASLERNGANISQAARELGVSRMTLYRLLAKHGMRS
jgi:DNA-binding NtrC family response regulator